MSGVTKLFDDVERTNDSHARRNEDCFTFLNRAVGIVWQRERELLEAWYADFPDASGDLRARFRSKDPHQHYAAWWELYVHALFVSLGYTMAVHPQLPDTESHPDFLAVRGSEEFYVEAAAVFPGVMSPEPGAGAQSDVLNAIDHVDASKYYVHLRGLRTGASTPSLRKIQRDVTRWVDGLCEADIRNADPRDEALWKEFCFGDWSFELRPALWRHEASAHSHRRFIGTETGIAGWINESQQLQSAVKRKGEKYGNLDKPLIIAVLAISGFVDDADFVDALYGGEETRDNTGSSELRLSSNPNGVLVGLGGPVSRKISAVLAGIGITSHNITRSEPTLWYHPEPNLPLTSSLPFRSARAVDSHIECTDATMPIASVFDLPVEWPGPEPAFPQRGQ